MSGFKLYEELKKYADVPVIFITAYSDIEHLEEAFNLGASDYIKKPFDLKELELRIKRLLFKNTTYIKVNTEYKFELFEYNKNNVPVKRHKSTGKWIKNQIVGFDTRKDFYLLDGVKYALKTTVITEGYGEINEKIYIQIQ